MRRNLKLLVMMSLLFSLPAYGHPTVDLKDVLGNKILSDNGTVQSSLPVSYEKSCGGCHDLNFINEGWHTQQGRLSTLTSDVYKLYYSKYGDTQFTNGLPADQTKLWLKWFGPKNVYGPGGMYNRRSVPHMFHIAPYKTTDPLDIDQTTADWDVGKCSICHPGGGYGLKDQKDNRLDKMDMNEVQSALNNGVYYGDYLINKTDGSGKLAIWDYHAKAGDKVVPNVRDNDCLICHAYSYDLGLVRKTTWIFKHPGWADTIGARLGTVNATMKPPGSATDDDWLVSYNATAVQNFHNLIGSTSNESCARCHAGVMDFDGDGKITPFDNIGLFGDLYILTSPGFFKRAQEIGDVAEIGSDGLPHKVIDKDKRPEFYNPKTGQWEKVPYLDVHAEAGMKCADCHQPVPHDYIGEGYYPSTSALIPSHDLAKGTDGFNVRSDLSGTVTCKQCHTNYLADHAGVFGPGDAEEKHLNNIHCTVCHIPQKFNGVIQTLIRTTEEGKGHLFWNFDEEHDATVPFYPDYVWFPHVPGKGQPPKLMIKPANAIAELYWRLSDGRTVPNRILHMVFRVDPETFDLSNDNRPEAEFGLIYFKDGKPYIPAKALNNKYVIPGGMVFWAYVGKYGDEVEFPQEEAQQLGIDTTKMKIVGRFVNGKPLFDDSNATTGWVVKSVLPNQIVDPLTNETKQIVKDSWAEAPFVDNKDEISFAAKALKDAIEKVYPGYFEKHPGLTVQYVYHLGIYDGSYIMSHNVAPVSTNPQRTGGDAAYANDPMHVLQCEDCHSPDGKFNRPIKKYAHIDTVPGVTVFEVPKAAIEGYSGNFTEQDLRELTLAYFAPTDVQVKSYDGNAIVKAVWSKEAAGINPLTGTSDNVNTSFVPSGYEVEQAFVVNLIGPESTLEVIPTVGTPQDYKVFTNPSGALKDVKVKGNKLIVTLQQASRADSNDVTVALVKATEQPAPETTTGATGSSTNAISTGSGGGNGGCSLSPSAGVGGALSYLLGLLPLATLRRRRKK